MGLNKSKGSTDVSSSTVHKSKSKSKVRHVDKQSTSSRPSSISSASNTYGSVKTPMRSPRSINETELASDSRSGRSEPKKFLIPQIVVTGASSEMIHAAEDDVQKTIKDKNDYGPYYQHRNSSTVDVYTKTEPEVASKTPSSSIHKPMDKGQNKVPEKNQERLLERSTASSHLDSFSSPSDQESEPKMFAVPQIVVTRASNEESASSDEEVQHTIRDKNDYSPYYRHRSPSTVDAYIKTEPKGPKTKSFL